MQPGAEGTTLPAGKSRTLHSLGSYLAQLRQERGVSYSELARRASVSRSTLYNWEAGRSLPRVHELETVLQTLGASPEERQRALTRLEAPRAQRRLREIEEPLPPTISLPHGGELLRSLRVRRGWTQIQVATALQIRQPTVARWERAESWPTPDLLLRCCELLQARPPETAMLLRGAFSLTPSPTGKTIESDLPERLQARLAAVQHQLQHPDWYASGDLLYLSLEAEAAPLLRSEEGRIQFARLLLQHAAYLSQRCQPPEAGRLAEQALSLLPTRGDQWNDLRLSADIYWAVWKFPMEKHARLLQPWLDRPLPRASRSWVMAQISGSLSDQGETELALLMKRQSLVVSERGGSAEEIQRRRNSLGEMLVGLGRVEEAADLIQITETMSPPIRVRMRIGMTAALLGIGKRSRAQDTLQEVYAENATLGISYYDLQIEALARRL